MAEYTKGKLFIECQSSDMIEIQDEGGNCVAVMGDTDQAVDDARRLAACWNACQGITTEALEAGVIDASELPDWTRETPVGHS